MLATYARLGAVLLGLLSAGPAMAVGSENTPPVPDYKFSFQGPFGTYDRAALQRGFHVYQQVCANCHSMKHLYYRNLTAIGLSEEQVKAIAATVTVPGGTDDSGALVERPALPSDHFRSPFANDKAARAANGGALPPDQSLIVKARENGSNYLTALLLGYRDAPEGVKVGDGQYYNLYMPGNQLAMAPPLNEVQLEFADGTPATVEQMAKDVSHFLTWAARPELEDRKRMGVKWAVFLAFATVLSIAVKKRIWKDVH